VQARHRARFREFQQVPGGANLLSLHPCEPTAKELTDAATALADSRVFVGMRGISGSTRRPTVGAAARAF
jgi:hypothetical protein